MTGVQSATTHTKAHTRGVRCVSKIYCSELASFCVIITHLFHTLSKHFDFYYKNNSFYKNKPHFSQKRPLLHKTVKIHKGWIVFKIKVFAIDWIVFGRNDSKIFIEVICGSLSGNLYVTIIWIIINKTSFS